MTYTSPVSESSKSIAERRGSRAIEADAKPATTVRRGTAMYKRVNVALFLAGFDTFSLLYCAQPLLPEFAHHFGVSPAVSSLALSLSTGFLAAAIFLSPVLSQAFGRRELMSASLTGAALLNVAAAAMPNWGLLLLCRAVEGLVLGGVPAIAMAYLAEEVDRDDLGLSMGIYVAGTALGGMAGRVGAGVIAEWMLWPAALVCVGLMGLVASVVFLALLPPSKNFVRKPGFDPQFHMVAWLMHLRDPRLRLLFIAGFLVMGAFVAVYNYAGFRLMASPFNLDQSAIGLIFLV
jgi:YNFM family putative membrane transporter